MVGCAARGWSRISPERRFFEPIAALVFDRDGRLEVTTATEFAAETTRWWLERVALYTNLGELDSVAELIRSLTRAWPAQPVFREAQMILESGRGHHDLAVEIGDGMPHRRNRASGRASATILAARRKV